MSIPRRAFSLLAQLRPTCLLGSYATTSDGIKTTYPSSTPPAKGNSQNAKRIGKEVDQGYLAFTKTSLFKITLPLQPPSSDPESKANEKPQETKEQVSQPVSQLNHHPHQNLHGPEQGEPADNQAQEYEAEAPAHSVVFLLHSGQPLGYIASLIRAEGPSPQPSQEQIEAEREQKTDSSHLSSQLPPSPQPASGPGRDTRTSFSKQDAMKQGFVDPLGDPPISFHTRAADGKRWSPSTGIGDFLRDAARIGSFIIRIGERNVVITVPSFEDRTRFLRANLYAKTEGIERLVKIKDECDHIAHSGTRRFAFAGVGILGFWWSSVAWLTFMTELGWDTMEPVTYLTGLGTLMGGYVWFLVHNREVSYRAVLNETTSRRQQKLYIERGFNVDRYQELIKDVKDLRKAIKKVAKEYDLEWDQSETRAGKESKRALKIIRQQEAAEEGPRRKKDDDEEAEDKDGDGQPDHKQKQATKVGKKKRHSASSKGLQTLAARRMYSTSAVRRNEFKKKEFSIKPYMALSRIDKPIGTWLLFWPCAWSIVLASHTLGLPLSTPLFYTSLFGIGALVMRGAGCTINDMWDSRMDRLVTRTKTRPLASGDVTHFQALTFLGLELSAGLAVLVNLNWYSILLGASSLSVVTIYPLMKRVTHWPQLVLGLAFNWGAMLGWSAVAGSVDWNVILPLYAGSVFWTLIYDTIYAHQDKIDDVHAGVRSTALLFGEKTKPILSSFSAATVGLFAYSASRAIPPFSVLETGVTLLDHHPIFCVGLLGAAWQLAWQITKVRLDDREDCWHKFTSNTSFGWIVFAGLAGDYALYLCLGEEE